MSSIHVLVLENNDYIFRMYERVLVHSGFHTLHTATSDEAIEALSSFDPDVVLLDWTPGNNHAAIFMDHLNDLPPGSVPRTLLISSPIDQKEIARYDRVLAGFIPKPITLNELLQWVEAMGADAASRVKSEINQITELAPGVLRLTWPGRVTRSMARHTMRPDLYDAHIVVLDMRSAVFDEIDFKEFAGEKHFALPNLRQILVVHEASSRTSAQYLMKYLPDEIRITYHTDLAEAVSIATQAYAPS